MQILQGMKSASFNDAKLIKAMQNRIPNSSKTTSTVVVLHRGGLYSYFCSVHCLSLFKNSLIAL